MPGLIPMIKRVTPNRPVLYRSHIQIRSDLADQKGTPQSDVWQSLWNKIQRADMFISHPIKSFVPKNVPNAEVSYMPAATDVSTTNICSSKVLVYVLHLVLAIAAASGFSLFLLRHF